MRLPSVYVGMALTHATPLFRQRFGEEFPTRLTHSGFSVIRYVGLTKGTAPEVFVHDIAAVCAADYMIAICDMPSIGLGMEMMERIRMQRPLLCAWHRGGSVTRMVTGAVIKHSLPFVLYGDVDDIVRALVDLHRRISSDAMLAQA